MLLRAGVEELMMVEAVVVFAVRVPYKILPRFFYTFNVSLVSPNAKQMRKALGDKSNATHLAPLLLLITSSLWGLP